VKIQGNRTTSRVRVAERQAVETAIARASLSREEELVLRLRHGLSVAPDMALAFRAGNSVELRARLSLMEMAAVEHLEAAAAKRREAVEADAREKAEREVAERLRRL